jgi:hypothetical protein
VVEDQKPGQVVAEPDLAKAAVAGRHSRAGAGVAVVEDQKPGQVVAEPDLGKAAVAERYSRAGAVVAVVEDQKPGQVVAEPDLGKAAVAGNHIQAGPAAPEVQKRGQVVAEMWEPKPRQPADRLESGFRTHRKTVRPPREAFRNTRRTVPRILLRFVRSRR